jgi:hypothetical protein
MKELKKSRWVLVLTVACALLACEGSGGAEKFSRGYMEVFVGYFKYGGNVDGLRNFFDSRVMTLDGVKGFQDVAELFRSSRAADQRTSRSEDEQMRALYKKIVWKAQLFKIRESLGSAGAKDARFFKAGDIIVFMRPGGIEGVAGEEGRKPDIAGQTFVIRRFPDGFKVIALL